MNRTSLLGRPLQRLGSRPWLMLFVGVAALAAIWNPLVDRGRLAEASWSAAIGNRLAGGTMFAIDHHVYVQPVDRPAFVVAVTPACSMVGRSVPIGLAALVLAWPRRRRADLGVVVTGVVAVVNIARIVATLVVGLHFGVGDLVRFHDWGGTAMTFASWAAVVVILLRAHRGHGLSQAREPCGVPLDRLIACMGAIVLPVAAALLAATFPAAIGVRSRAVA